MRNIAERLALRERFSGRSGPTICRRKCGDGRVPARAGCACEDADGAARLRRHTAAVETVWNRMASGEDFWTVVHKPFKQRELTRNDLAALIDRGLTETWGAIARCSRSSGSRRPTTSVFMRFCISSTAISRGRGTAGSFERLPSSRSVFSPAGFSEPRNLIPRGNICPKAPPFGHSTRSRRACLLHSSSTQSDKNES